MIRAAKITETFQQKGLHRLFYGKEIKSTYYRLQEYNGKTKEWENIPVVEIAI